MFTTKDRLGGVKVRELADGVMVKAPFGAAISYAPLADANVEKLPAEPVMLTKAGAPAPLFEKVIEPETIDAFTWKSMFGTSLPAIVTICDVGLKTKGNATDCGVTVWVPFRRQPNLYEGVANVAVVGSPEREKLMSDEFALTSMPEFVRSVPEMPYERFGFDTVAVSVAA